MIPLSANMNIDGLLSSIKESYKNEEINDIDGVKIDFQNGWVHLRKSNTEPILRVYAEAESTEAAAELANEVKNTATNFL
jgi:phosphomannomutase